MLLNENINPSIVKNFTLKEKTQLCEEIRSLLIKVVSKNGGHLASNLGTVELIVAMHSVFETPNDKFIYDVGHQAYTHKILTGRMKNFDKLRTEGGISGFPRPSESEHDAFIAGHSSISVSAALGISNAMKLKNEQGSIVVVVGDGAMTGGEFYEGINNTCKEQGNLIILLNDNEMSISKSRGALATYLTQIRSTKEYFKAKKSIKTKLGRNAFGRSIGSVISGTKQLFKNAVIQENLFENFGLEYLGPVDGHNIEELVYILELARMLQSPCLVHVKTKKGKGYIPAEENAGQYHGVDKKNFKIEDEIECNSKQKDKVNYSEVFGKEICRLGSLDKKICLITAAMKYATGCNYFSKQFKNRFFDVGIAESHAVTFAAGLASQGFLPVFAVYSTFLQRSFDQLLHDAAIEGLHIVLAIDRAGLNGEDGETHQGIFDIPLLTSIPGTVIFSPSCIEEQKLCIEKALYCTDKIAVIRYPRGIARHADYTDIRYDFRYIKNSSIEKHKKTLFITFGRLYRYAKKILNLNTDLLLLIQIHPLPEDVISIIEKYDKIIFFEESSGKGGIAEALGYNLLKAGWQGKFHTSCIDGFIKCADVEKQIKLCGLDYESMVNAITEIDENVLINK